MQTIQIHHENGVSISYEFYEIPDKCPFCQKGIVPISIWGYFQNITEPGLNRNPVQVVFQCPISSCRALFICQYKDSTYHKFYLTRDISKFNDNPTFSTTIQEIPSKFIEIYHQAYQAEYMNLLQIAGPGYRKSLEFLIKDYVCKDLHTSNEKDIVYKEKLGKVISNYIEDGRIKSIAKRAAWLGNDETHYLRIWVDKDLTDLKKVIDMTINWIELVESSRKLEIDMPDNPNIC
jgi:hypothetical protein